MTNSADKSSGRFTLSGVASGLLIVLMLGLVLRELASFLQPLFIAVFFFYISWPIVKKLESWRVPRVASRLVPLLIVVLVLLAIGWTIGAHIDDLASQLPGYKRRLQGVFQASLSWTMINIPSVGDRLESVLSGRTLPLGPIEGLVKAVVGNFFGFLSFSVLVVFFLIFILNEAITLPKRLADAYGERKAARILEIGQRINHGISGYVYLKTLASLAVAALSTVAMIAFGLDLAILWGALIFFGNFVPYVGSIVAVTFPITVSVLQFTGPGAIVAHAAILIGAQILIGNYIEPKFAGQRLNLSPLIVLLSLAFWGWLWGVVGLIISIPTMVSLKFVLENIPATRELAIVISHVSRRKSPEK